jgi:hypothetical protein
MTSSCGRCLPALLLMLLELVVVLLSVLARALAGLLVQGLLAVLLVQEAMLHECRVAAVAGGGLRLALAGREACCFTRCCSSRSASGQSR